MSVTGLSNFTFSTGSIPFSHYPKEQQQLLDQISSIFNNQTAGARQQREPLFATSQIGDPHLRRCHKERQSAQCHDNSQSGPYQPIFGEKIPKNVKKPIPIIKIPNP